VDRKKDMIIRGGLNVYPREEHVKRQLAAYKYPRHVWIVDELPHGGSAKVFKQAIAVSPLRQEAPWT
jgi:long-chain acyl-CoA synthetase